MMITFERKLTEMDVRGFTTYAVLSDSQFIGRVFQFSPERYASNPRWMAQAPDGTLYGWLTAIWTRKAAAKVLAEIS